MWTFVLSNMCQVSFNKLELKYSFDESFWIYDDLYIWT
jgi:hypothetical protein